MQHNNTPEGELSYFETALLLHLRDSHPHMAGNPDFIRSRADEAANVYEHSIRDRHAGIGTVGRRALPGLAVFQVRHPF